MTDEQAKHSSGPESVQEVDRIRDIIFGRQMQDYDQQFQAIQRDLARLRQEVGGINEQLSKRCTDQNEDIQKLRDELGRTNVELLDKLKQTGQELAAGKKALQSFRDEIPQLVQRMAAEKVDRGALGELFVELGTQMLTDESAGS